MSQGKDFLHSHSALERELRLPKHLVLVDERFRDKFDERRMAEVVHYDEGHKIIYLKVPVLDFVKQGGIFKNLSV